MALNATFNNISVISLWSVLLVEETGVPGENLNFINTDSMIFKTGLVDLKMIPPKPHLLDFYNHNQCALL